MNNPFRAALLAGQYAESERAYRATIDRVPGWVDAWNGLAIVLTRQGRPAAVAVDAGEQVAHTPVQ